MTQHKEWIVTTSPDRPAADVAKDLASAGLTVEQVLDEIGSITGRGSPDLGQALRAVKGVADASPGADIDIGPPGSGTTW